MPCENARVGRILFQCHPSLLVQAATLPPHWIEEVNGLTCFVVFVDREKYVPTWDKDEDRAKYRDVASGQFAQVVFARYGFQLLVNEPDLRFVDFMRLISLSCIGPDLTTHIPLTVIDFVRPMLPDRVIINSRYASVRQGRIVDISEEAGAINVGGKLYSTKFKMAFQELRKRRYLG